MKFNSATAGLVLTAALAASTPVLAQDYWQATPWPSESASGLQFCFLAYDNAPRSLSITATSRGAYFLSVGDPILAGLADGAELSIVFPSGWRASGGARAVAPQSATLGLDGAHFSHILDELQMPGMLTVSTGSAEFSIAVPDQLDGRIRNLRGPGPVAAGNPCLDQLVRN